jgi:hypothetical protein
MKGQGYSRRILKISFSAALIYISADLLVILTFYWVSRSEIPQTTQGIPEVKFIILGGHSIGHSKQKSVHVYVPYSERFPR